MSEFEGSDYPVRVWAEPEGTMPAFPGWLGYHSLEDAYENMVSRFPNKFWHVRVSLETPIQASMIIRDSSDEVLEITVGERTGKAPRNTTSRPVGVGFTIDYDKVSTIFVDVGNYEDPILDRGTVWVDVAKPESADLILAINPNHGATLEKLLQKSKEAEKRALQLVDDVLEGRYERLIDWRPEDPDF